MQTRYDWYINKRLNLSMLEVTFFKLLTYCTCMKNLHLLNFSRVFMVLENRFKKLFFISPMSWNGPFIIKVLVNALFLKPLRIHEKNLCSRKILNALSSPRKAKADSMRTSSKENIV